MPTQVQALLSKFLFLIAPGVVIPLQRKSSVIPSEAPELQKLAENLSNRNDRELDFQTRTLDCCLWFKQPQHATERPQGDHLLLLSCASSIWFDASVKNLKA